MKDEFYKKQYFDQLNERLDTIETKVDGLSTKVTWIYASASAVGILSSFIMNFVLR